VGVIRYEPLFLAYVRRCRGLSQQLDMGKAKVEHTNMFFRQPGLPSPFDSKKFQRRALSNAYLTGGVYTWIGSKNLVCTMEFIVRSIVSDSINGFHILVIMFRVILREALPQRLCKGINEHLKMMSRNLSV